MIQYYTKTPCHIPRASPIMLEEQKLPDCPSSCRECGSVSCHQSSAYASDSTDVARYWSNSAWIGVTVVVAGSSNEVDRLSVLVHLGSGDQLYQPPYQRHTIHLRWQCYSSPRIS